MRIAIIGAIDEQTRQQIEGADEVFSATISTLKEAEPTREIQAQTRSQ